MSSGGALPGTGIGSACNSTLTASDRTAPYRLGITGGTRPRSLSPCEAGILSGTPTGTVTFTSVGTTAFPDASVP